MNRRKFIQQAAALSSSALIAGALPTRILAAPPLGYPGMVIWKGRDYFEGVKSAVQAAGGISSFVPANSTVGLLVNSRFDFQAALVKPDITIALVDLIMETNPKEIVLLQVIDEPYWQMGEHGSVMEEYLPAITQVASNIFPSVFNEEDFVIVPEINGAKYLRNAEVVKRFLEVDVFINVPVIKHHATTLLTGALKNMMGITTRKTNVGFHLDSGEKNDPEYLGQCIADLNMLRKPDLVVADATELIINNGPSGPGDTVTPETIIVSRDPVAVDSYGCRFLDLYPDEIRAIVAAKEIGIGEMDLDRTEILEIGS
jgi:uncharacterized protein (DUF362 family)